MSEREPFTDEGMPGMSKRDNDNDDGGHRVPAAALPSAGELLRHAPDAVVLVSAEGTIEYANPAAERLFGRPAASLLGGAVGLRPEEADAHEPIQIVRPDGEVREVEYLCEAVGEHQETTLVHLRDVTERNKLQARLQQGEKMEAIGRLAGGVAHDFNNLLAAIIGFCRLAEGRVASDSGDTADGLRGDLIEIRRAADTAKNLTGQLLNFSTRHQPPRGRCSIGRVIKEHSRIYEAACGGVLRLTVDVDPQTPDVAVGQEIIDQIILNLAVNARDAVVDQRTREGHSGVDSAGLLVTTRPCEGLETIDGDGHVGDRWAELCVIDRGPGIPDRIKARVFEPFFTTKPDGLGCGIGLSTVYGLVHRAGGSVHVSDTPGGGATIRVVLPCHKQEAGEQVEPSPIEEPVARQVLVVEDDDALRYLYSRVLRSAGYEVHASPDGLQASKLIDERCRRDERLPDVILSDVVMPGLTGIELAVHVHRLRPRLPVVLMSGYANIDLRSNVLGVGPSIDSVEGPHSFLQKPFEPDELTARIEAAINPAAVSAADGGAAATA